MIKSFLWANSGDSVRTCANDQFEAGKNKTSSTHIHIFMSDPKTGKKSPPDVCRSAFEKQREIDEC